MTQPTWTIRTAPTRLREEWKCALCGAMFISDETLADLFDEHEEHQGVVCPACLAAGPEAAEVRLALRRGQGRAEVAVRVAMPIPAGDGAVRCLAMPGYPYATDFVGGCLGAAGAG